MKKFGNKNNLRFVGKKVENRSRAARAGVKKLRIVAEVVRIGEQELVEVGCEKFKDRCNSIKEKQRINYSRKNCKRLVINSNQSNN